MEDRTVDKKFFRQQLRIINVNKQIDKRLPCWASDIDLVKKIQVIQTKLISSGVLKDNLNFKTVKEKQDFLRPKINQLCDLMDQEYTKNIDKLKKQREDMRKANRSLQQQVQNGQKMSRAAMLAQGYKFSNPKHNWKLQQKF